MNAKNFMRRVTYFFIVLTLVMCYAFEKGDALYINKYIQFYNVLLYMLIGIPILLCLFVVPPKSVITYIVIIIFSVFIFLTMNFVHGIIDEYYFTDITSPDEVHQLAIYERKSMFQCEGIIFERQGIFCVKKIGSYSTDFLFSVHNGNYSIDWKSDGVIFTYQYSRRNGKFITGERIKNTHSGKILYSR